MSIHFGSSQAEQAAVPNDIMLKPLTGSKWDFDGSYVLGARGRVAFLWDAHTGDLHQRFDFSEVFRVTGSDDGSVYWEFRYSEHPNYFSSARPHPSFIRALAIFPGAADILTGAGSAAPSDRFAHANFIRRGNVEHGTYFPEMMGHSGPIDSIEFSRLGNRVLTYAQDGSGFRLWSTLVRGEGFRFTPPYNIFIFKGDEVMFSASGKVILDVADWRVLLWDAEDVRQLYLHEVAEGGAGIVTARICPLDERLLILTDDGRLSVRSIAEDAEVAAIEPGGHGEAVESEAGAVSGGDAGTGRQASGTGVGRDFPGAGGGAEIQTIEFCRGGDEFLVVRAGGSLTMYDTATCEIGHEFKFGGHIQRVTVSADGNFACISMGRSAGGGSQSGAPGGTAGGSAAGSQGGTSDEEISEYILLDLQKMELISTLPGRMVNSAGQDALRQLVGFSPHGDSILFVDSEGRTAELWDPASGYEIATVPLSYVSATAANYNRIVEGGAGK